MFLLCRDTDLICRELNESPDLGPAEIGRLLFVAAPAAGRRGCSGGVIANVSGAKVQERAPVYFRSRTSDRPAALLNSLASIVPSLSGSAALKRFSTIARNSFLSTVPSLSGSAAAKSLALSRPRSSRLSRVPS